MEGKEELIGQVLHDTHRVVRRIGAGGMGEVYEAEHVRLRRSRFAVKVLHERGHAGGEAYRRFRREAEIASELGHPNIIFVTDFYETPSGRPCIVMEFLEGEDLAQRLERQGRLQPQELASVMRQVGGALAAAHARGVIHRDLKPQNIFMARDPEIGTRVKLLDFGISKIKDSASALTGTEVLMGTPYYMAPEQAEGKARDVDARTDIFALGIIAYQCLSGELPFRAPTPLGVLRQVCDREPRALQEVMPGLPSEVSRVIMQALSKSPAQRHQTVEDFVAALTAALARAPAEDLGAAETLPAPAEAMALDTTLSGAAGQSTASAETTAGRRRYLLAGVGVLAACLLFLGVGALVTGPPDGRAPGWAPEPPSGPPIIPATRPAPKLAPRPAAAPAPVRLVVAPDAGHAATPDARALAPDAAPKAGKKRRPGRKKNKKRPGPGPRHKAPFDETLHETRTPADEAPFSGEL